jgi:hypothetical protein
MDYLGEGEPLWDIETLIQMPAKIRARETQDRRILQDL